MGWMIGLAVAAAVRHLFYVNGCVATARGRRKYLCVAQVVYSRIQSVFCADHLCRSSAIWNAAATFSPKIPRSPIACKQLCLLLGVASS